MAVTISSVGLSNAFAQGQREGQEQLQQNVTNLINIETKDMRQCILAEQATGLGLDTSLLSNTTEYNACVQIIYLSPDRIVLTGEHIEGGEYNTGIWRVVDRLEKTRWLVENVLLTGQGSEGNPHSYIISMTRQ